MDFDTQHQHSILRANAMSLSDEKTKHVDAIKNTLKRFTDLNEKDLWPDCLDREQA